MSFIKNPILASALVSASVLAFSGTASATSTVEWKDPVPNVPGECNGLGYEWTVAVKKGQTASFVSHVGAKSWSEPGNPDGLKGWTHTSNWVAFELKDDANVTIQVSRQQGVLMSSIDNSSGTPAVAYTPAGDRLYPAFSVYQNWEETGCESHQFNNSGATPWMNELVFADNVPNAGGSATAKWTGFLPAGKYSIAVGGNNALFCAPTKACYGGRHGYRAVIKAN